MTDTTDNKKNEEAAERSSLLARAKQLGLNPHHNLKIDKLRKLVNDKLSEGSDDDDDLEVEEVTNKPTPRVETPAQKAKREQLRLVRIRLTCMNPAKKENTGEIFTVSNAVVGTVRRMVPFEVDEGWHVEQILLNQIKEKEYQTFVTRKLAGGKEKREPRQVREFAVEIMDPLTPEELKDLAQRQAMSKSV